MTKIENSKNFLKTIKEKITNPNIAYDIDTEDQIYTNSPKLEEKIIEEEITDIPYSKKLIPRKNKNKNNLKESLISPTIQNPNENNSIKLSSIKSVTCKIHKKQYLKIDSNNFEIVCEKCIEEGNESQLELINKFLSEEEENIFNCYKHNESKGSFFCDECKQFICKMCFAEEHRTHKCHLPQVIKEEFVQSVKDSINYSSELNPILEENVNDIKKIAENLKKQKVNTMVIPQNTLKVISNNNRIQIDLLMEKTNKKFMGIDNEVHDDYTTYNMLKDKTKKYLDTLKIITDEINNENKYNGNNYDLCKYHKDKFLLLNEILNYINTSFNFINIRLNNTNHKYDENHEKIENSLNLMSKEINNYEKSCISSISTGRENRSIILRRYIHFAHNEIKYFKNSIIGFASNDNVYICGLSLCGLYIKKKKNKTQNNNTNTTDNNKNINISEESVINDDEKNKKIKIQITVSTMSNQLEGEKLFVQKCELGGVRGSEEPSEIINFEKGVKILKEKLYLIKVENLSENNYIDIWTGDVGKIKKKNIQVIRCHNTGTQFLFKQAEGIQSDFDEFENGIIEGILYSTNK